ncbi:hypothetical protein H2200_011169 [Cladophialophora chaetospira]|uniref:DUF6594 domain-containing protein n=1 Tax=Cladophialophora chaetospira TaxID=386627 RepID=A0AA38X057_9EURO|nr:hypothetical protein H2200_011169 [Cladophialophora chaetospira]
MVHIDGYRGLAWFMVSDKDRSPCIFRRFDELAARNLLYLQSQLLAIEDKLKELDVDHIAAPLSVKAGLRNWNGMETDVDETCRQSMMERTALILKLRETMREYREMLVLEHQVRAIERPSSRTLEAVRKCFNNVTSTLRPGIPALDGLNSGIFNDTNDLLSLRVVTEDDRLTRFLQNTFPVLFAKRTPAADIEAAQKYAGRPGLDDSLLYYSERRLHACVAIIYIVLSSLLLFGAMFNLYFVDSNPKRLGFIAGYTVVFALCVGFLTNARRAEIFGACAAYAAVLVVFVSGGLGGGGVPG